MVIRFFVLFSSLSMSALSTVVFPVAVFNSTLLQSSLSPSLSILWVTETVTVIPHAVPQKNITSIIAESSRENEAQPLTYTMPFSSSPQYSQPQALSILPFTTPAQVLTITETSTVVVSAASTSHLLSTSQEISVQRSTITALTVTETATIVVPASSTSHLPTTTQISVQPSTTPAPVLTVTETATTIVPATPKPGISRTTWSAPPHMTDLSAFNISAFSGGQKNLAIVNGIPAAASAVSLLGVVEPTDSPTSWDNSSSVLQLLYPANSINPANPSRPIGGAQFYATPLEMADAKNITLQYSAFFPEDFEWVLAGKLPGLYGGHAGCSGGYDALDCFSTRLMWRKGGIGELYLYAPKKDQTESLCAHPQSVCDATYGLSVGRGSFIWARGKWTKVQQCVTLNTPGKQDGVFTLDVNDQRVIERNDVFYRSIPPPPLPDVGMAHKTVNAHPKPGSTTTKKHSGLGGLLGPLLGDLLRRDIGENELPMATGSGVIFDPEYHAQQEWEMVPTGEERPAGPTNAPVETTSTGTAEPTVFPSLLPIAQQSAQRAGKPVGFLGLFFSSFFGGHDPQYATPKDQYVWFKDFAIVYNS